MNPSGIDRKRWGTWAAFAALFAIYWLSVPRNHSEAEDAYRYAKVVESGSFGEMTDPNRLLALPAFGAAYRAARACGYAGRAFPFMIAINRLSAVVALGLFFGVARRLVRDERKVWAATLSVAFCYGFWRYAGEAEVYLPALALALAAWWVALRGRWALAGAFGGLGVLFHLLNAWPLLGVLPLLFFVRREPKRAVGYGLVAGGVALLGYATVFSALNWGRLGTHDHALEAGFSATNGLRGLLAFGQNVVSGNFLFGFSGFRETLARLFPSRMLAEEFFMGDRMPGWIAPLGLATLAATALAGVAAIGAFDAERTDRRAWALAPLWLVGYAAAVVHVEAGSPELWLMALVPLWLTLLPFLRRRVAFALVGALFAHNLAAGLLPLRSEAADYHAAKCAWAIAHAGPEDVVLVDYEPVLISYLQYRCPARVVDSGSADCAEIRSVLGSSAGKAYALASFFEPAESMRVREPRQYARMRATGDAFRPDFEKVAENEFGGVYVLKKRGRDE